jgi:hypothetical protein
MRWPLRIKRSNIVKYVAPIYSDTTWAALPPEEAVINQPARVVLAGLTGGACHLRAIRGGLWRCLAVTHGYSGHFDLRSLLYRSGTTRMVRMGSPGSCLI